MNALAYKVHKQEVPCTVTCMHIIPYGHVHIIHQPSLHISSSKFSVNCMACNWHLVSQCMHSLNHPTSARFLL